MTGTLRLADIAAQARVSESTVSRVLNNKPVVSDRARQAVLTAIDILGYERPSALRRHATGLVGLIVPELTNPIFPAFAQVIEAALSRSSYTAVLCAQAAGGVTEDEYIELLRDRGTAGILFVGGLHADSRSDLQRYRTLIADGLPIVFINGTRPEIAVPAVGSDDRQAVDQAVHHLAQLRHRRIGMALGPDRYIVVQQKLEAFGPALARHIGPDAEPLVEHSQFSVEGGAVAAARLLARGATGIITGSDIMALGAIGAVRSAGLRVPEDVSVIGYDDSVIMPFTDPPLTTMRQNVTAIGEAAVAALLEQIEGRPVTAAEYLFRPQLVVRGSTGPAPEH
ncbi:MAG TPA: LacI family DNA-binding transcriptional regulator [Propionibacteriaceae bacterium]|nr:LacI family DNA-binding transcriptional regulator [Propionibacteriaceae bacterium]